jgi:hypothetical protein
MNFLYLCYLQMKEGQMNFLFLIFSRPALRPTKPPIQCVRWLFPCDKAAGA